MSVEQALREAELQLPGMPATEGEDDPRWQVLITLGGFVAPNVKALAERAFASGRAGLYVLAATTLLGAVLFMRLRRQAAPTAEVPA